MPFQSLPQHTVNGRLNNNSIIVANVNGAIVKPSAPSNGRRTKPSNAVPQNVDEGVDVNGAEDGSNGANASNAANRRKKQCLTARERNVRRIESNERERLRMHGLNEAFQVHTQYAQSSWLFIKSLLRGRSSFRRERFPIRAVIAEMTNTRFGS